MEIALLILKITGMILGAVLGILIAVVCLILFAPIRYRGEAFIAKKEEGGGKEFGTVFFASWLLRLVRMYISREKAFRVRIKLLFFTLYDTEREDKPKKEKRAESNVETKAEQIGSAVSEVSVEMPETKESTCQTECKEEPEVRKDDETEPDFEEECPPKKQKKEKKQTIQNFCDKLKRIKEKIVNLKAKAERLKELWEADYVVRARRLTGRQLRYLLRHAKPRKLEGYVRFGFEDPAVTGYTMAAYGILYPIWSPKISVEPDFEKGLLDCRVTMKGKIKVWHLLRVTLVLFFSKDMRRAIKDIRKEL